LLGQFILQIIGEFFGALLAFIVTYLIIESRVQTFIQLQKKAHILSLNIRDLWRNVWLSAEIFKPNILENGTQARYWLEGLKQFHEMYDQGEKEPYIATFFLLHMLEVDNSFLEKGITKKAKDNAEKTVAQELFKFQSVLLQKIQSFNGLLDSHQNTWIGKIIYKITKTPFLNKIDFCPTAEELQKVYKESNVRVDLINN